MFKFLVVSLLLVSPVLAENKVALLLDLLKLQSQPTKLVNLNNCWNDKNKVELLKNAFVPTVFIKMDSLNASDFLENSQDFLFTLDLTQKNCTSEKILQNLDKQLLSHPYRWIIFMENEKLLNGFRALVDSNIVIALPASNESFALKQFYKLNADSSELYFENFGKWNEAGGIVDERDTRIISRRRSNLRGKLISASYVTLNRNSRNHLTDFREKQIDSITKYNYLVINTVLDVLNATRKELFVGTWGYYNARSKKWSGMMGDVVHKGVDMIGKLLD